MKTLPTQYISKVKQYLKNHLYDFIFLFILIILLEVLYILIQFDLSIRKDIKSSQLSPSLLSQTATHYPMLINSYEPYLTAQSAILMDNYSKRILFSKNPNLRFSMASTTKVMTALVALEYFAFNDILTVERLYREGSVVGFSKGEQIYFDDMLYALLLQSGNDAAYIIADNYPGGVDAFVKRMNEKAREFKLSNTHFAEPAGLNDDQNYTTALDLARFSSLALENPTISRVVGTQKKIFTDVSGTKTYEVHNLNRLLGTQGVIGIKTGTTEGAGEVLATAVSQNGHEYIIVVMKSEDRFLDTQNILNLLQGNVTYLTPEKLMN